MWDPRIYLLQDLTTNFLPTKFNTLMVYSYCTNKQLSIIFCIGQCNCCVEYVPLPFLRNLTYIQSLLKVLLYSSHPLCNTFNYTKCF